MEKSEKYYSAVSEILYGAVLFQLFAHAHMERHGLMPDGLLLAELLLGQTLALLSLVWLNILRPSRADAPKKKYPFLWEIIGSVVIVAFYIGELITGKLLIFI